MSLLGQIQFHHFISHSHLSHQNIGIKKKSGLAEVPPVYCGKRYLQYISNARMTILLSICSAGRTQSHRRPMSFAGSLKNAGQSGSLFVGGGLPRSVRWLGISQNGCQSSIIRCWISLLLKYQNVSKLRSNMHALHYNIHSHVP